MCINGISLHLSINYHEPRDLLINLDHM
jgi:hypothetical protein